MAYGKLLESKRFEAKAGERIAFRVLLADDDPAIRTFYRLVLEQAGMECDEAGDGMEALRLYHLHQHDLIVLDVDMPDMDGLEACRKLRSEGNPAHLKIILVSGRADPDMLAQMLLTGADDFLTKPFSWIQLQARVQASLRLKEAQERTERLNQRLHEINQQLEKHVEVRDVDLIEARNAMVLALAKLCECRHQEAGEHLHRLQFFCRLLSQQALKHSRFVAEMDLTFVDLLSSCVPLHDIGKVGLPDHILLKPGVLTNEERLVMQSHTLLGAETLQSVARQHGFAASFLKMSIHISRSHHEWYNGTGYPDRLKGTDIPLAARIVAICDVYDALRSRRAYKPPMPHQTVVDMICQESGTHFDPHLIDCFRQCVNDFERIYSSWTGL